MEPSALSRIDHRLIQLDALFATTNWISVTRPFRDRLSISLMRAWRADAFGTGSDQPSLLRGYSCSHLNEGGDATSAFDTISDGV
jgi:hypothetical protein